MSPRVIEQPTIDSIAIRPQVRKRMDAEQMMGLTQSVREIGVQQPVLLRRVAGQLVLVDGARRLAAATAAGRKTIPAIVEEGDLSEDERTQHQLILNCQREGLKAMEEADAIHGLIEKTGWSATQVAAKLGLSSARVSRLLALRTLPESIRDLVDSGRIAASAAYELTHEQDTVKQVDLAAQLASGHLTRDGLSGLRKAARQTGQGKRQKTTRRITAWLDARRSITLAGEALSNIETLICWLEELLAKARKARLQSLSLPTFLKMLKDQRNRA